MENKGCPNRKTPDFYRSCDIFLLKLYLKFEVDEEFSCITEEVLEELQKLGFLNRKKRSWKLTRSGEKCVREGGIEKYLNSYLPHLQGGSESRKKNILLEYPFLIAILVCFFMIICMFTWIYLILL